VEAGLEELSGTAVRERLSATQLACLPADLATELGVSDGAQTESRPGDAVGSAACPPVAVVRDDVDALLADHTKATVRERLDAEQRACLPSDLRDRLGIDASGAATPRETITDAGPTEPPVQTVATRQANPSVGDGSPATGGRARTDRTADDGQAANPAPSERSTTDGALAAAAPQAPDGGAAKDVAEGDGSARDRQRTDGGWLASVATPLLLVCLSGLLALFGVRRFGGRTDDSDAPAPAAGSLDATWGGEATDADFRSPQAFDDSAAAPAIESADGDAQQSVSTADAAVAEDEQAVQETGGFVFGDGTETTSERAGLSPDGGVADDDSDTGR
jgi:hypothetical protein